MPGLLNLKMSMMKKIITVLIALLVVSAVIAQNELPIDYPNLDKVLKKTKLTFPKEGRSSKNGGGYSVSLKLLKAPPPKVALVSFFTFDPGLTKSYSYSYEGVNYISTTTVTKKNKTSNGTSAALVEGIYYNNIDKLIAQFKSAGMDLLLPDQFLNTDEKKKYYESFTVAHDKFNDWAKNLSAGNHTMMFGWPGDYKPLDVLYEPFANYTKSGLLSTMDYKRNVSDGEPWLFLDDEKMQNSVGFDLASKLDVDAVLIVYFTIYAPKATKICLQNANMMMLGKNPVQPQAGEKKPMFYRHGQFYAASRFQPDITIFNVNKKDEATKNLNVDGFDNIITALATKICEYLQEAGKK
jgi:hypothetical protein